MVIFPIGFDCRWLIFRWSHLHPLFLGFSQRQRLLDAVENAFQFGMFDEDPVIQQPQYRQS